MLALPNLQENSQHTILIVLCGCRYSSTKSVVFGFLATFFPIFDVPVFWPILLLYFCVLFFITMKRQIKHMIKHRYIPFDLGKKVSRPSHCFQCTVHWRGLIKVHVPPRSTRAARRRPKMQSSCTMGCSQA